MKELRPYQHSAINAIKSDLNAGISQQLLCMAMGLGKTFTAVKAVERLDFKSVLWGTDDERLLEQSALAFIYDKFDVFLGKEIEKEGFISFIRHGGTLPNGYKMGIIKADLFKPDGDVVFGSAQTLWRRLDKLNSNQYDCLVLDEAHCWGSNTFYKGLSFFNPKLRLGLSGTPYRKDGVSMSDIFQKVVFEYNMFEGMKDGYLCEIDAIRIKTNCSLDNVHILAGDFNEKELSEELNTPERNNLIAQSYLKYAKGRQAIGFGIDIQHCIDLAEAFQNYGINAIAASSDEERTGDKNEKIKGYKSGKYDVIFNVNLLSKGFDHPDTGCSIAAAPTKSLVRYMQGPAGRISRLKGSEYVSKFGQNAILLDVVDNTRRHNLVNAWELDKEKDVEDRWFVSAEKKEKLLENRRKALITHEQKEDEKVKLLALPKVKIYKTYRTNEEATVAQLEVIKRWGFDVDNNHYNKWQISEIFAEREANSQAVENLKKHGYKVDGFVSVAQVQLAEREIAKRKVTRK